jgi:WD40 repeat protein
LHVVLATPTSLILVDSRTGEVKKFFNAVRRPASTALAFSADDRLLFQTERGGELAVFRSVPTAKPALAERSVMGNAAAVAVSPDGKWLAGGGDDSQAAVWNLETGNLAHTFQVNGTLYACRFSPDSQWLATGSLGGMLKVWSLKDGALEASFAESAQGVRSLAFSPDGHWLAFGGIDRVLRIVDTRRWEIVHEQPKQPLWIEGLEFSPDGQWLYSITGSWSEKDQPVTASLMQWKVVINGTPPTVSLEPIKSVAAHTATSDNLALTNDGKWVVTPSVDRYLRVWNAKNLDLLRTISIGEGVHRIHAMKGDAPLILLGGLDGGVSVWDVANGEVVARYAGHKTHVFDVTATPDGRLVISAGEDDRFLFWPGPLQKPGPDLERAVKRLAMPPK